MVVKCEGCKTELTEQKLDSIEDDKGHHHLICHKCKKQAKIVMGTFGSLQWDAFVVFVNRHKEEMSFSSFDIPVSKK